jgi:hypothetical protein
MKVGLCRIDPTRILSHCHLGFPVAAIRKKTRCSGKKVGRLDPVALLQKMPANGR